eukprot:TRINITY_DN9013_c0_g1_i2.p1 TRINITY_DN9013_c0_g1~~TRINITY_DN9013_c0_g1_i2.p1  ORF type:complete len:106 (-),score=14.91 TRINITY_DN9013_c0_g1_i2:104-421(-)
MSTLWSHLNPCIWDSPMQFDPNRWLQDFKKPYSFIGFGQGNHRCIGESRAYLQIKHIIFRLLQHFHFQLPDNKLPLPNWSGAIGILRPAAPVIMSFQKILPQEGT